jgi:uncharacterized membrane protein YphA (DoxX/SURF4 family)
VDTNTWLWILAGFLAAVFAGSGLLKLTRTPEELAAAGLRWTTAYGGDRLRLVGTAELVGAALLVLPPLVGAGVVVPLAALVLAASTGIELAVHVRRRELLPDALRTLAMVVLCLVLAAYRLGPEAF